MEGGILAHVVFISSEHQEGKWQRGPCLAKTREEEHKAGSKSVSG